MFGITKRAKELLQKFDISIPLVITRRWMYFFSLFMTVMFVLLPFSVLSYSKLHEALIPPNSPKTPLYFTSSSTQSVYITGKDSVNENYRFDPYLVYKWNVNLNLVCGDELKNKLFTVDYAIISQNATVFNDFFILDCDISASHVHNNWFVPYNLRFWMPPITVNYDRSIDMALNKFKQPGHELMNKSTQFRIELQEIPGLIVNNDRSWMDFQIEFSGFRYYIVKYYILSFLVGVFSFWSTNTIVCLITTFRVFNAEEDEPGSGLGEKRTFSEMRID